MIVLRDIRFSYPPKNAIFADVSLEIGPGLTLLIGPNGAGKSTLLKIIAGVEEPDSGTIEIDGFDLWRNEIAARQELVYVPEYPDLTPYATIRDIVALVCGLRSEPLEQGMHALARAGLSQIANRSVRELSMGQRRRAVIAVAWIGRPKVALLDEPLESMDRSIREAILSWVDDLWAERATIVIATHQIEPFLDKADRIITARNATVRMFEPLPTGPVPRRELIDRII